MKRKVDEVELLSDPESPLGEDECVPSPDSAVILSKDEEIFHSLTDKMSENGDSDVPERSPDSGLCGGSGGEFLEDFTSSLARDDPTGIVIKLDIEVFSVTFISPNSYKKRFV